MRDLDISLETRCVWALNCRRSKSDLERRYMDSNLLLTFLAAHISGVIHGFLGLSEQRIDFDGACLSISLVSVSKNCSVNFESVSARELIKLDSRISC